jgi:ribosomal protein L11
MRLLAIAATVGLIACGGNDPVSPETGDVLKPATVGSMTSPDTIKARSDSSKGKVVITVKPSP